MCLVSAHGSRWSICTNRLEHATFAHFGFDHNNAIRCAAVAPRPRCVTFITSTPLVITSCRIASPNISRATRTGIGPRPGISHVSSPSTHPRSRASRSTCRIPRYRGFGARLRLRGSRSRDHRASSTRRTRTPPAVPRRPSARACANSCVDDRFQRRFERARPAPRSHARGDSTRLPRPCRSSGVGSRESGRWVASGSGSAARSRPQTLLTQFGHVRGLPPTPPAAPAATGSAAAAGTIASTCAPDNTPARIASATSGNVATCFDVSNRPPRLTRRRAAQLREMLRRGTRARPLPRTGVVDPRREQHLRARRQPFDPIERRPHVHDLGRRNITRVELTEERRDTRARRSAPPPTFRRLVEHPARLPHLHNDRQV